MRRSLTTPPISSSPQCRKRTPSISMRVCGNISYHKGYFAMSVHVYHGFSDLAFLIPVPDDLDSFFLRIDRTWKEPYDHVVHYSMKRTFFSKFILLIILAVVNYLL